MHPKINRATRPPIDSEWLDEEVRQLEQLVSAGETLELIARLATMLREAPRLTVTQDEHSPASAPVSTKSQT
jgi:hypothetical protein